MKNSARIVCYRNYEKLMKCKAGQGFMRKRTPSAVSNKSVASTQHFAIYRSSLYRGMSLIEVLVAMFILSISLVAALRTASYATSNQSILRDRVYAEWVGRNRLAERATVKIPWQDSGELEGEAVMGNKEFIWKENITYIPGANPLFRLVVLTVAEKNKPKATLFRVVNFIRKPR